MNVTIVGGGNIGTQFAVHCADFGHKVIIYTTKSDLFDKSLKIVNKSGELISEASIEFATNNAQAAFSNADLIFITTPAFCADDIFTKSYPFIKRGAFIGLIPGTGGMECVFKDLLNKDCTIFGLQRVPSVARLIEYGKIVCAEGYRDKLYLGSIPNCNSNVCCKFVSDIFGMRCEPLPNFLNLTLTPSNPILHTTRLFTLFKDYEVGKIYPNNPLFYEDWENNTSELLFKCDYEVQTLCSYLKDFDLSYVKSLKEHYESDTPEKLTAKIKSINAFKGLKTPMKPCDDGFVPDFNSRYFLADFGYGLTIINQIAEINGISLPNIVKLLDWYRSLPVSDKEFKFKDYNIDSYLNFKNFYKI